MKRKQTRGKPKSQEIDKSSVLAVKGRPSRLGKVTIPVLVFMITVLAFLPTLQNGFVNWDDGAFLLDNPHYRGLGWEQLKWMFTTCHLGSCMPLNYVTYGLDYILWGMNPVG